MLLKIKIARKNEYYNLNIHVGSLRTFELEPAIEKARKMLNIELT